MMKNGMFKNFHFDLSHTYVSLFAVKGSQHYKTHSEVSGSRYKRAPVSVLLHDVH